MTLDVSRKSKSCFGPAFSPKQRARNVSAAGSRTKGCPLLRLPAAWSRSCRVSARSGALAVAIGLPYRLRANQAAFRGGGASSNRRAGYRTHCRPDAFCSTCACLIIASGSFSKRAACLARVARTSATMESLS